MSETNLRKDFYYMLKSLFLHASKLLKKFLGQTWGLGSDFPIKSERDSAMGFLMVTLNAQPARTDSALLHS